ncbi:MAG: T9SS type A sorting domain-containing protein [Cryomorphaceae bacterium]|nr:T9SS type A sorting domain-containing protein [Flavobacteriales bacterium]
MKTILHTIVFLLIWATLKAQSSNELVYNVDAGIMDIERVEGMEVDFLYSCGRTFEFSASVGLINKTDVSGNLYWSRRIEFDGLAPAFNDLEINQEGELLVVGYYSSGTGLTGVFLKLNSDGEILMAKSLELSGYTYLKSIHQKSNGNYLVVGENGYDIVIFEFDSSGNMIDSRRLGTENREIFHSMDVNENGDILLVGSYSDSSYESEEGLLVKLNENLEIIWSKLIFRDVSSTDTPVIARDCVNEGQLTTVVLQAPGDEYLEIESRGRDIAVIKIDDMGSIASEILVDLGYYETVHDLQISADGDIFLTGDISPLSVNENVESFVLGLDGSFTTLEANMYSRVMDDLLLLNSIVIDDASNYLASVGQTSLNAQVYRGYQTHHTIGADGCAAAEIEGVSYDPEFILEDIELDSLALEAVVSDLAYDVSVLSNSVSVICSEPLSSNSLKPEMDIEIYPNPCADYFQIEGLSKPSLIRVRDVLGRTVLETKYLNGRINAEQWPGGMYLIEIEGEQTYRIVKN